MKLPTWIRHCEEQSVRTGALSEVDRVLTLLRAEATPAPKLEDRILMRVRVEQAGTVSRRKRGEAKGFGRGSLLDFGLAGAAVCLMAVLILGNGAHRRLLTAAVDRLQPSPIASLAEPSLGQEARPAVSSSSVPSLGLAAARREPPRQVATGTRAGRVSFVGGRARRRGRVRRPSAP